MQSRIRLSTFRLTAPSEISFSSMEIAYERSLFRYLCPLECRTRGPGRTGLPTCSVSARLSQLGKRTVSSSDWRNPCLRHSFPICQSFLNLSDVGHTSGIGRAARELVVSRQQLGLSRRDRRSLGYWLRSLMQFPGPG